MQNADFSNLSAFCIANECRKYTAFSDGTRKLECARVPQGATNSPLFFMQVISMALRDLSFVIIYMDDLFIHSETAEEHLEHIKIV